LLRNLKSNVMKDKISVVKFVYQRLIIMIVFFCVANIAFTRNAFGIGYMLKNSVPYALPK